MDVTLGTRTVKFPSPELQELVSCNHILQDMSALRGQLHRDGYLYIKNFHNREEVLQARGQVLKYIQSTGDDKIEDLTEGTLNARCGLGCVPFMEGEVAITHSEAVRKVLEGSQPFTFFTRLFGAEVTTFDYKWLRAMHKQGFTGAHVDSVYMSRGTENVLTMWTPFSDITPLVGTLAVCEGSNRLERAFHDTYGKLDLEASGIKGTGWFTEDPLEISSQFGGVWKTANFEAGDALIFTLRTVHMSTANLTNLARISCDTRWQPKNEKKDWRYFGEPQVTKDPPEYGVWAIDIPKDGTNKPTTVEALKSDWGFHFT